MKAQTQWKNRSKRHIVTLEAFDAQIAVYRHKKGNDLTSLIIVSIGEFLTQYVLEEII